MTVDEYIANAPAEMQKPLKELRKTIRAAAPMAEELISYRIPMYKYRGHLVGFAAFKSHCSLFVTNSAVTKLFAKELAPFEVKHTTIHFKPGHPLPAALVKKIVKVRIRENKVI